MAHSLPSVPAIATPPLSSPANKSIPPPPFRFPILWTCSQPSSDVLNDEPINRRTMTLGLSSIALGLTLGDRNANAAARRPPPPPQQEKQDPNVSGVLAKVLASKRRKEAMKETVAKLREKGKLIDQPSPE